jgi:hypothetical protein
MEPAMKTFILLVAFITSLAIAQQPAHAAPVDTPAQATQ